MVRKRGPYDRIDKIMSKKRMSNNVPELSNDSNPKKVRNALNDSILSLYKEEAFAHEKSSVNSNHPVSNEAAKVQNDERSEDLKNIHTSESSKLSRKSTKISERRSPGFSVIHPDITLKDVGGLHKTLWDIIRKFFSLTHPEVISALRVEKVVSSQGILLHGPPGCGKTFISKAISGALGLPFIGVGAQELVGGISGESENKIKELFSEAAKNSPCILFIDEIDAIAPKRETSDRGMEKRMVAQLLKSFDELTEDISSRVMVIGATNRPDSVDTALRRGGRFSSEYAIGIPDENTRLRILKTITENMKLSPDFDLEWVAHHTPGYVGADLKALTNQAVDATNERIFSKAFGKNVDLDCSMEHDTNPNLDEVCSWMKPEMKLPPEELESSFIELRDFQVALKDITPFSKREGFAVVPSATWDDVGALNDVKEKLTETIIWPVKYKKLYEISGMQSSKGILLYGPKGCGKTLLAKVVANECNINFLSVKGPELLNMYLGESERAVRQCFQRARNSAPCVIFFDEIDALCPRRTGSNSNAAAERVVNTLLTEMDGIEDRHEVYIIAATNRLGHIDSAMLRPGRLGKKIYVGLPTPADRVEVLKSLTKNKTRPKISDDVDLEVLGHDSRCTNFSGADLRDLINHASGKAIKEHLSTSPNCSLTEPVVIELRHFDLAFTEVGPSVRIEKKMSLEQNAVQS